MMKRRRRWTIVGLVVCLGWGWMARVLAENPEIRSLEQFSGTVIAPLEERKQVLSSGDKVFIALDKTLPVKKGDLLEIFQPAPLVQEGKPLYLFIRAGQAMILETVQERLVLAVIETNTREIAVGDRVYFPMGR